jgi:hypothetical protein
MAFGCAKMNDTAADGGTGSGAPSGAYALHMWVIGNGEVRSSAPAVTCRSDCQQTIDGVASVHLVAVPDAGWKFDGWQGACTGAAGCDIALSADHELTAYRATVPSGIRRRWLSWGAARPRC